MTMPVFHDVPISCINQAAETYAIPAELIMAIIFVEGGRNGIAMANNNGTFDYGVMQINSTWLERARQKGASAYDLQYDACQNVMIGTWILSQNLQMEPNLIKAVGNYHSHTPALNYNYAKQVLFIYGKIRKILAPGVSKNCDKLGKIC
ncbi:MAG: lytic transglycosylase domain-containing protein [Gammaproteobacteria bacterium]|jgi:soluble lytic murein transglycosylase-like protein|nr:lytic transglycosylase domain-containing protein [Gammaproteobacteria bacterium]